MSGSFHFFFFFCEQDKSSHLWMWKPVRPHFALTQSSIVAQNLTLHELHFWVWKKGLCVIVGTVRWLMWPGFCTSPVFGSYYNFFFSHANFARAKKGLWSETSINSVCKCSPPDSDGALPQSCAQPCIKTLSLNTADLSAAFCLLAHLFKVNSHSLVWPLRPHLSLSTQWLQLSKVKRQRDIPSGEWRDHRQGLYIYILFFLVCAVHWFNL